MGFIDEIKRFGERAKKLKNTLQTEEATKTSLIMPFFTLLGYDVFDPEEFVPEFTADVGIKKGEKCDYAVLDGGKPIMLIEAKWVNEPLEKHVSQLFRYFVATEAKFAVLTNGIVYRFFTDLEEKNKMDEKPFLEINVLDLEIQQIGVLEKFQKAVFNADEIINAALELKYSREIEKVLLQDLDNPSDELVWYFLSSIGLGQGSVEKFRPIIKRTLDRKISEMLHNKTEPPCSEDYSSKSFYVLNTNMQGDSQCDEDMIREHKAAAYGKVRKCIAKIQQGDVVFLYRNSVGIVAYGVADGSLMENSYAKSDGEICEENYMHLDNFKVLEFPFTAAQMKLLSNSLAFQLTMYKIDNESGVAFIKKINADYL